MELTDPPGLVVVERLRAALAPGIDPAVVGTAFAAACAGSGARCRRDGRRASTLTPSGVPVEVSVTGGAGRSAAAVRYVAEPGSGLPFFRPRLEVQRRSLAALVELLPARAAVGSAEVPALLDLVFPDPAAVPARTRFATFVGVVHAPHEPAHVAGLKVYANLRAADPRAALARLGRRWRPFAALAEIALAPGTGPGVTPQFVALEVSADGEWRHKLYVRTRTAGPAGLAGAVSAVGADPAVVDEALAAAGLPAGRWARPVVGCLATGSGGGADIEVSVHATARAAGLDGREMDAAARALCARHGDAEAASTLLGDADADADADDGRVEVTVVGVGLRPGGAIGKVNVYAAPVPGARQTDTPTSSNSGWTGSRVGS